MIKQIPKPGDFYHPGAGLKKCFGVESGSFFVFPYVCGNFKGISFCSESKKLHMTPILGTMA